MSMQVSDIKMIKLDKNTRLQTHTGFSKWYHDVSCPAKEASKG